MNTPNKLTVARMIATPVFMAVMLISFKHHYLVSMLLFIVASLTDMWDGKMARKNNMVTDFGKFMDPLADKMLTTSAFLGFMYIYGCTDLSWQIVVITFIVLFREFAVSSIRLVAVTAGGKVVAANMWGKCKTVSQMVAIIFALAVFSLNDFVTLSPELFNIFNIIIMIFFWISAALCVISGAIYIWGGKEYIANAK